MSGRVDRNTNAGRHSRAASRHEQPWHRSGALLPGWQLYLSRLSFLSFLMSLFSFFAIDLTSSRRQSMVVPTPILRRTAHTREPDR
jgi:hypothetical protein